MRRISLLLLILTAALSLFAISSSDIENKYEDGSLWNNQYLLRINPNEPKDLLTCKLYYSAKLAKNSESALNFYKKAALADPNAIYAQKANLELAKLYFLKRDYSTAQSHLEKINLLDEKHYWLARIYYNQNTYSNAVNSANTYINLNHDQYLSMDLSCLLFDLYSRQQKSGEFIQLKNKMNNNPGYKHFEAFILWKEAQMLEKNANYSSAIDILKLIVSRYPNSQYRVFADDMIIELNKKSQSQSKINEPNSASFTQPAVPKSTKNNLLNLSQLEKNKYYLQYNLFSTQKTAEQYKSQLEAQGLTPFIINKEVNSKSHFAVIQGPFLNKNEAVKFLNQLKSNNINGFIFVP